MAAQKAIKVGTKELQKTDKKGIQAIDLYTFL